MDIYWDKMVKQPSVKEFRSQVIGQKITALSRRGKYLFFHLSGGAVLVMHMKMTGSLLVNPSDDRFTRAVLHLDNGDRYPFLGPAQVRQNVAG